ncbi:MAG: 3-oxoacyl-[acyl-carrier-protein] synthase II, partial [Sphingobacteriales bacterium]
MKLRRVVITGLGAITPLGNSVDEYWKNLVAGQSGANLITKFDASLFKTQFACEVKNFDIENYMNRKEARKLDPFVHYAIASTEEAFKDAGLEEGNYDPDRSGVIWGSGIGGLKTFQEEVINFAKGDGTPRFNPFFIPKMIVDIAAGHISMRFNLRGPNFATVSACASSTHAIIDAFNYIRLGKSDIIVTGGSEASVVEAGMGGFNA